MSGAVDVKSVWNLEKKFKAAQAITLGEDFNVVLPQNKAIQVISIRHNVGTLNGITPTYAVNTIFKKLSIEVDGDEKLALGGYHISNVGSPEILLYRQLSNYIRGFYVGIRDDRIDLIFKDPIPAGITKELKGTWEDTATAISSAADSTTYTGATYDVYYLEATQDKNPNIFIAPKNKRHKESITTNQTGEFFLPSVGGKSICKALLIAYLDDSSLSALGWVKVSIRDNVLFEGKLLDLKQRAEMKKNITLPTGMYILEVPAALGQWGASDCKIEFVFAAAPTAGIFYITEYLNEPVKFH